MRVLTRLDFGVDTAHDADPQIFKRNTLRSRDNCTNFANTSETCLRVGCRTGNKRFQFGADQNHDPDSGFLNSIQ